MSIENSFKSILRNEEEIASEGKIAGNKSEQQQQEDIEQRKENRNELLKQNGIELLSLEEMSNLSSSEYSSYQQDMKNKIFKAISLPENSDKQVVFEEALGLLNDSYLDIQRKSGKL